MNNATRQTHLQRRAAWKRENGGRHTQEEWDALCQEYGYRCARCGQQSPLAKDHIKPLSKGGSDEISNLQPLCDPCNKHKTDNYVDYRPEPQRDSCALPGPCFDRLRDACEIAKHIKPSISKVHRDSNLTNIERSAKIQDIENSLHHLLYLLKTSRQDLS